MNGHTLRVVLFALVGLGIVTASVLGVAAAGGGDATADAEQEAEFEGYVAGETGYLHTNANDDAVSATRFTECEDFEPTDEAMQRWEDERSYLPAPECIQLRVETYDEETGEWTGDIHFPKTIIEKEHSALGDVYAETDIETVDGASGTIDLETGEFHLKTDVDIGVTLYNVDQHGTEYDDLDQSDAITAEDCHIPSVELRPSTEASFDASSDAAASDRVEGERLDGDNRGVLVSNSFTIPEATQCGTFFGTDLNAAINDEQGLPAAEGDAEVVFDVTIEQPQPTGTLSGTVESEGGNDIGAGGSEPLAGATVEYGGRTTTADENGSFSFAVPAGNGTASASAFGHTSATEPVEIVEDNTTIVDFSLERTAEYVVRAPSVSAEPDDTVDVPVRIDPISRNASPVTNFELVLEYDTDAVSLTDVSEADFTLEADNITADNGTVTVSNGSILQSGDGKSPSATAFVATFELGAETGSEAPIDFNESQSTVNEQPLDTEAIVGVFDSAGVDTSVAENLVGGDVTVITDLVDLQPNTETLVGIAEAASSLQPDDVLTGGAGVAYDEGSLTVAPATGTVEGTVTNESAEPVRDATVELVDAENRTVTTATTDEDGSYALTAETGEFTLTAGADGYESNATDVTVRDDETVVRSVTLTEVSSDEGATAPVGGGGGGGLPPRLGANTNDRGGDEDQPESESGGSSEEPRQESQVSQGGGDQSDDLDEADAAATSAVLDSNMTGTGLAVSVVGIAGGVVVLIGSAVGGGLLRGRSRD